MKMAKKCAVCQLLVDLFVMWERVMCRLECGNLAFAVPSNKSNVVVCLWCVISIPCQSTAACRKTHPNKSFYSCSAPCKKKQIVVVQPLPHSRAMKPKHEQGYAQNLNSTQVLLLCRVCCFSGYCQTFGKLSGVNFPCPHICKRHDALHNSSQVRIFLHVWFRNLVMPFCFLLRKWGRVNQVQDCYHSHLGLWKQSINMKAQKWGESDVA